MKTQEGFQKNSWPSLSKHRPQRNSFEFSQMLVEQALFKTDGGHFPGIF